MNQVRLVADLAKSKEYYKHALGCKVDGWGHAERKDPDMGFILQQAEHPEDVRPNNKAKQIVYPNNWEGPPTGWDSYAYAKWETIDAHIVQFREAGAIIHYEIKHEDQGDMVWKEFAIRDPDGYVIVIGAGKMK
ncbi:VOC family protein [Paenibacillus mesophilus]|uniref:VOC family protein n=1 Tax=Paenibacillus mesophilus TaxID=2582849 RepID=UPI00110EE677|nr:VOC family protein [Paenibacillus mesophilus]TMV46285.1 VOC family protein [Paenibacillus mesophilus]